MFSTLSFVFSAEIDDRLANLQRQINELKRETSSFKKSSVEIPFEISGELSVLNTTYDTDKSLKQNNNLYNKTTLQSGTIAISTSKDGFDYGVEFTYNNTDNNVKLDNVSVSKTFAEKHTISIGRSFIQVAMENDEFSMAHITYDYSKWLNWIPSIGLGAFYSYIDSRGAFFLGAYGNDYDEDNAGDSKFGISNRGFVNPIKNNDTVIHIGYDVGYWDLKRDDNMNVDDFGNYLYNEYYYIMGELGLQYKFITVQTEAMKKYTKYNKERLNFIDAKDKKYSSSGLTSQLIIGLTGEKREYSPSGSFNFPNVINPINKGGFGAFELVGRYERWNDKTEIGNIEDGSGYLYSLGLNWFPVNAFEILFNYAKVKDNSLITTNNNEKKEYSMYRIETRFHF